MAFFRGGLNHMLRSDRFRRAAALTVLSLFTLTGVLCMAEAFHHHDSSTVTNATSTEASQSTSSAGSSLAAFYPISSDSAGMKRTFNRRGDKGRGDREMKSIHFDTVSRASGTPSSISVTAVNTTPIFWFSTANTRATTTFETIFTTATASEASTPLPFIDSIATKMEPVIASLSARVSMLDGVPVLPSSFTRSFMGPWPFSIASHGFAAATTSDFRIATYDPSPSSGEPDNAAALAIAPTTEIAAASTSLVAVTEATLSSMSQSLRITYGASISPPTTSYHSLRLNTILTSSTTVATVTSTATGIQDPARPSSESQAPHQEGQSLPPNYNPFANTGSAPSGSLTALASMLSSTPIQGVPSTPLSSIVAALSSTLATTVATVTSASVSLSLTGLSTQLQSAQPTSSSTSIPLVKPSSNSKEKLTIGLSVCVPLLVAFAVFIVVWLRCRYIEKKRADDFEENVIWVTPRPRTPRTPTKNRTPRKDRAKRTPVTPTQPDPTFMDGLNDVERAMVEDYQKKCAEVNARRAAQLRKTVATLTSGRDPETPAQRRPGGPMMQQGLDGASDAPLRRRPSQMFTRHQDSLPSPLIDANEFGLAASAPESKNNTRNDNIRNAIQCFQPTRLSTITDKSGEIEMPEIPAPFGGAGSGPINQGGKVKGRWLERFIMKKKGMMPLDG